MEMEHDSIIVGAGPAGLSAAVYLARFNRKVLVLDKGHGRSGYYQLNENYLGFPNGIHARELRELGRKQAERFGVVFKEDEVDHVEKVDGGFLLGSLKAKYSAKTLIIATGVTDNFPPIKGIHEYIGRSVFWCITCDGYKTNGKKVIIVGQDEEAACTCLQFLLYTKDLTFVTNCDDEQLKVSAEYLQRFKDHNIKYIEGRITELEGTEGMIKQAILEDGTRLDADLLFSMQGAVPNSYLAQQLGVHVNQFGYIKSDLEQKTNIPFVYAAGDVTRNFSHQVATAVHEGSMAAQAANYELYFPYQRT